MPILKKFNINNYIGGTFGYIINKKGCESLINYVNSNGIKHGIDYMMKKCFSDYKLNILESSPQIVLSDWVIEEGDSDIQCCYDNFENDIINNTLHNDDYNLLVESFFPNIINKNVSNICVIHSCTMNNKNILDSLLNILSNNKLYDYLDHIYIVNIGKKLLLNMNKVTVINYSNNTSLFEKPAINLMNSLAKYFENNNIRCNILYLHTKGTTNGSKNVNDWVNLMLYFLVEKWKYCVKLLEKYDTVGVNLNMTPVRHYSGNFWWTTSSYLAKKTLIKSNIRHDCEFYILNNEFFSDNYKEYNGNNFCIYSSEIDHYMNPYDRSIYDNEDTINKLDEYVENLN